MKRTTLIISFLSFFLASCGDNSLTGKDKRKKNKIGTNLATIYKDLRVHISGVPKIFLGKISLKIRIKHKKVTTEKQTFTIEIEEKDSSKEVYTFNKLKIPYEYLSYTTEIFSTPASFNCHLENEGVLSRSRNNEISLKNVTLSCKKTNNNTDTDTDTISKTTTSSTESKDTEENRRELELAKKFAPVLKFDRSQNEYGYPISASLYYEEMKKENTKIKDENSKGIENNDLNSVKEGKIPTYFYLISSKKQVRILYWWYYGMQHSCNNSGVGATGRHHGDWERVMVIVSEDSTQVASVTYWQHGGFYTRIKGPRVASCTGIGGRCKGSRGFQTEATHPIVFVGKIAHGSYHDKNTTGSLGALACRYFADDRNPGSDSFMQTEKNLVNLKGLEEDWAIADRKGGFMWGPNGVSTHPNQPKNYPTYNMTACKGSAIDITGTSTSGCYKSECLSGDVEELSSCQKECKPGYTNYALLCKKSGFTISSYRVKHYDYDYKLPVVDAGLLRKRDSDNESEWEPP